MCLILNPINEGNLRKVIFSFSKQYGANTLCFRHFCHKLIWKNILAKWIFQEKFHLAKRQAPRGGGQTLRLGQDKESFQMKRLYGKNDSRKNVLALKQLFKEHYFNGMLIILNSNIGHNNSLTLF